MTQDWTESLYLLVRCVLPKLFYKQYWYIFLRHRFICKLHNEVSHITFLRHIASVSIVETLKKGFYIFTAMFSLC